MGLVPTRRQTPAQYGFFRDHLLVIRAAKPPTRQQLHVSMGLSWNRVCSHPAQASRPRSTRYEGGGRTGTSALATCT